MATVSEQLAAAVRLHQAGNLQQAEQKYQQVLRTDPENADALHLFGLIASHTGRHELAMQCLDKAIAANPSDPGFHCNRGAVARAAGRLPDAEKSFREALRLNPHLAIAHFNLGSLYVQQRRFVEAVHHLQAFSQSQPQHPQSRSMLGYALMELGRLDEAVAQCQEAVRLDPSYAAAHNNLGSALARQGRVAEAASAFERAVQLQPSFAEAHNNLGSAYSALNRLDEAVESFQRALRLNPEYADAHFHLGLIFRQRRQLEEAFAHLQRANELRPNDPDILNSLGLAYRDRDQLDEAEDCFRAVIQIKPADGAAWNNLGVVLRGQGRLAEALKCYQEAIRLKNAAAPSNWLSGLNYDPDADPATIFAEHRRWGQSFAAATSQLPLSAEFNPDRHLRVGYLSPGLHRHPVAYFLEPILANHDPNQVEAIGYADVAVPDVMTERLRALAHGWRDVCHLSDAELANLVRQDRIDLLVDLTGHVDKPRLGVLAAKPAAVQISYLGYPNTTGLPTVDYYLTDASADPTDESSRYTEKLLRLPGCFCCYAPPRTAPTVTSLPALRTGHITFGSLHALVKLNPRVLDLWASILHALPSARLLVFRNVLHGRAHDYFRSQFSARGLGENRVELRQASGEHAGYMGLYADIDIALDAFPWNGHTTACEALWMGVPTITLRGDRHASRMVASILTAAGLQEWIADTSERYRELAIDWASDRNRLARLRSALRDQMRASPLCDGRAFARELEAAYRSIWRERCRRVQ